MSRLCLPLVLSVLSSPLAAQRTRSLTRDPVPDLVNLGIAVGGFHGTSELVVFEAAEAGQGLDWNGDGDTSDRVVMIWDPLDDSLTNLGLAMPVSQLGVFFSGRHVAFEVDENASGATDLNGDGDASDRVIHLYDADLDVVTNVGVGVVNFSAFGMTSGRLLYPLGEAVAGMDLNGDGDMLDSVLQVRDVPGGTTVSLGLSSFGVETSDELAIFQVGESAQGGTDLNGDGDTLDFVLFRYDPTSGAVASTGVQSTSSGRRMDGSRLVFAAQEFAVGDLNGDGDMNDLVLHVSTGLGPVTNLGLAAPASPLTFFLPDRVVFTVSEMAQGGIDLNGDGDALDAVVHFHDYVAGTTTSLGLAGNPWLGGADRLAFAVWEPGQGGSDLNGDGDAADWVIHTHRFDGGTTTSLGLALGFGVNGRSGPDEFVMSVDEAANGGADLNGDGDATDNVAHLLLPGGRVKNLGRQAQSLRTTDPLSFTTRESREGVDLNGDGDTLDDILQWWDRPGRTLHSTGLNPAFALARQGYVLIGVREDADGIDRNGDGDAIDYVAARAFRP